MAASYFSLLLNLSDETAARRGLGDDGHGLKIKKLEIAAIYAFGGCQMSPE
ncbi:MAG: hypothetical protein IPM98_19680 [Lewinellaceae bacterium]|nr:hypothetical protein [Lewinellaceae bacterium]